jgi:hypothetical protein
MQASQIGSYAKLALRTLQEIRIKYRYSYWSGNSHRESETVLWRFEPKLLANDDTVKQLLARSRYFAQKQIKVV